MRRHVEPCSPEKPVLLNSFRNPQPVQTDESISDVVAGPQAVDQSSRRVQDRLESTRQVSREADQHAVPIVQPGVHRCNHKHLKCGRRHSDESDVAWRSIATRCVGRWLCSTSTYRATVVARLTYAASACRGFTQASDRQRINTVIDRARRLGYCSPDTPTFDELCDTADDELFSKAAQQSNHVLHALLPPSSTASQRYNLRHRAHSLQLLNIEHNYPTPIS